MVQEVDINKHPKIKNSVPEGAKDQVLPDICFYGGSRGTRNMDSWWERSIGGVQVIERDAMEIAEARAGHMINNFPNTEFVVCRNASQCDPHQGEKPDTMLVFVGESWCYGGKIRDMQIGFPSDESIPSFLEALNTTMGVKMSSQMNCDLHQSCWPGDQTSNMFEKAESIFPQYIGEYKKIRVAIQITDSHRDENCAEAYPESNHVRQLVDNGDVGMSAEEWLAEYDRGFLRWADRMRADYPDQDIEFVIWKNFNPWNISDTGRKSFKCHTVDKCMSHYFAEMDGFPLDPDQKLNNTNLLSLDENINFPRCTKNNTTQAWRDTQLKHIERFYDYINDYSSFRSNVFNGYPTPFGHRVWAVQLCTPGDWFYDVKITD